MTVKRIEDMALSEVPHFDSGVVRAADEIPPVWVECNLTYAIVMGIVMLDKLLRPNVPYFDRAVG